MPEKIKRRDVEQQLGRELLRIHEESYGKGAAKVTVLTEDDLVVCLLDDLDLLPTEEFLIENGQAAGVVEVRGRFQQAIETTFRAAVERATGRRTTSFASVTKLNPNYVVEIFRLAPTEDGAGG